MRFVTGILLSAVFLTPIGPAHADSEPTSPLSAGTLESIDAFVNSEMTRQRIPGLAVGIYSRGSTLLAKGYGLANVELSVPVRAETVFQSGSIGKQFTAAAIMMLIEEGKLSLNDSITRVLPHGPPAWRPILIRNLLSHTSGLSEYESAERIAPGGAFYLRLDLTEEELLRRIESLPIEWPAGEKWGYRNTNYLLLGLIIHKVTGKPYGEYLQQRIFGPLGMGSTRIISERDIVANRSSGYELDEAGQLGNQQWVSPTFNSTADGGLYFNVLDLARWDEALYTTRLLSQSSLDRLWTVYPLNDGRPNWAGYGFGWFIGRPGGRRNISHGGAWQGFTGHIARYPEDSLTVVVLTNLDALHAHPKIIAEVIAGLIRPPLMPLKLQAMADSRPEVAESLREDLDRLMAGRDFRSAPSPELAAGLPYPEAFAVMSPVPLPVLQKGLARVWPGGSLTLVNRGPLSNGLEPGFSLYRLAKDHASCLIVFAPGPRGSAALFGVMSDRPYES
ncbi:MAG TPA: serine hydrolase domain-containing protein [Steroidobacteraceae bacterium]|nr:serine hydrolase domain-containing protein [Steroidobacteraceae bacterium]